MKLDEIFYRSFDIGTKLNTLTFDIVGRNVERFIKTLTKHFNGNVKSIGTDGDSERYVFTFDDENNMIDFVNALKRKGKTRGFGISKL